jgi:hypothetical protein
MNKNYSIHNKKAVATMRTYNLIKIFSVTEIKNEKSAKQHYSRLRADSFVFLCHIYCDTPLHLTPLWAALE